jgi:hypothetical protein
LILVRCWQYALLWSGKAHASDALACINYAKAYIFKHQVSLEMHTMKMKKKKKNSVTNVAREKSVIL